MTFESVVYPGYYLVSRDGKLFVSKDAEKEEGNLFVSTEATGRSGAGGSRMQT